MNTATKKKFSKDDILVFFLKNRSLLLVLIFSILLSLSTSTFLTGNNLMSLARQISANCIIGVGYTLLLASDSVDLSAGYICLLYTSQLDYDTTVLPGKSTPFFKKF